MASGMDWLSALLLGGGTFAKQVGDAGEFTRQERLKQEQLRIDKQRADQLMTLQERQLAQNQAQFDATRGDKFTSPEEVSAFMRYIGMKPPAEMEQQLGPAGRISKEYVPAMLAQAAKLQENQRQREQELATAAFMRSAQGEPAAFLPGDSARGADPEASAPIPGMSAGRPAMSQGAAGAGLTGLGHKGAEYKALMETLFPKGRFTSLSENSLGTLNADTGETNLFDRPVAAGGVMPEARPGFEIEISTDKNGRQTYHEKRINSGVEHDALARAEGFGSYAQAPPDQQRAINAKILQNRVDVSSAQGAAALSQRPYTDVEQAAFAAHNNILSSISLLKQFSPQEIATYTGLVNRPIAEAKNMLAGLGIADADKRFNEFKPIMGRLQGTAFGEGGKQLTGVELAVVSQYTPTGNERGGAAEVMAKVRNLEAFTKMSRESRMYLAKTGRGAIDADQLDAMIRQKMEAAGMPIPQPNPGWNDSGGASRPQLGEPGYTGVRNEVTRGSAPLGKIMLEGPDGSRVYWPEKRPIPPGARRID